MKKINFKNIINNFKDNKLKKYYIVVSIVTLLVLVGGTYAYFTIITSGDGLSTLISGKGSNLGNPTMVMKTSNLYLNVNASMMSEDNIGTEYLATTSPDELAYGVTSDITNLYNNYFDAVYAYCNSLGDETCSEKQNETLSELFPSGPPDNPTDSELLSYFKLLQEKLSTVADVPNDVKTAREAVDNANNEEALKDHIYTLATVSLPDGDETLNCTYKFKVTASVKNEISDDSDQNVGVSIGENFIDIFRGNYDNVVYDGTSLGNAVSVGEDGVIVSGTILGLSPGSEKNIEILASLYNTKNTQDDLADNSYTINIEQAGFECYLPDWMNNVEGHMDFAAVSLSTETDTSGGSEINYLVSNISSDTELYGMKYCINTKGSIKNCEWVNINSQSYSSITKKNSKSIDYELTDYDKYYFHLMNNDGYVITSSYDYYKAPGITLTSSDSILTASITKKTFDLDKYCINTSLSTDDCEWNKINETSITYTMPNYGTYYVHVVDENKNVSHSSFVNANFESNSFANDLIKSTNLWRSGLEGDGYRFTGSGTAADSTSPKNFICFGTTDKDTCTAKPSTYMYRIIGVFADDNGNNHVKLIKYTQLGVYKWNADYETDTDWADSDLYKGLNGSYFLTNTAYSYMQDATWLNKIADWKWTAVNTLTNSSGPDYNSITAQNIYLHEMNRTGKTSTIGEWTTPIAKIGLMYVSDYMLSLGESALSYTGYSNASTLKTGWMHQSNNDTSADTYEWTMARNGYLDFGLKMKSALPINYNGYIVESSLNWKNVVYPAFYLAQDTLSSGGTGTLTDPYILN